ncbi:MAG: hypothetical protein OXF77_02630, partial [Thaumarchaeota archaeon]|nr:hypothetical protein [Nitrososphaerota archaeon]
DTSYIIKLIATPQSGVSATGISQEITINSGKIHCSVDNFIGPITKTTINSELSNSDAFGFKIDIDDTKIPTSNISMLDYYEIDLFASGTTTPSLFTKTIAKIESFEILKDCSGSTNVDNCFEYPSLAANTQYDVKITGIYNNQPINKYLSDLVPNSSYQTDGGSNFFRIKDSLSFDDYHNFSNTFADAPKKISDITNGKKISYSFKLNKYTGPIPSEDNSGYPYFRQLWIGLTLSGYEPTDAASRIIIESDRDGNKTNTLGPGMTYTGIRGYFYVGVSITYNDDKGTYDILYYNLDISSKTISPEKDPNNPNLYKVTKLNIDTNNLPTFHLEIDAPINGETKVYFNDGTNTHEFINTLKNGLPNNTRDNFNFFGTFGSKGLIIENLQFQPLITDCPQPSKTITVTSGKKPSPGPGPGPGPGPAPPPKPIYSKDMPQLYLTTYGNSAFNDLSKFIGQQDILSQLLVLNVNVTDPQKAQDNKDFFNKITQLKWYIIRDYNIRYFQNLKSFINNKENNVKNYMVLIGDYLPLLPPKIKYNDSYDGLIVGNSGCNNENLVFYGYSSLPYPLNAVNGPVDFGIPYNTKTPVLAYNLTSDTSSDAKKAFKNIGCSFILDHVIPLAISNKNNGLRTTDIEITTNADITPNDSGWKTWDAGNYPVSKYNSRYSVIQRNNDGSYTIIKPNFVCPENIYVPFDQNFWGALIQQIPPELAYYTVKPDKFNSNDFLTEIGNNKLNTILQCEFNRVNGGNGSDIINYTKIFGANNAASLVVPGMFVDFDVDLLVNKITFKKKDD